MLINETNFQKGYKATAAVLLLYYHLIIEGGFTNDQTFYLDPNDFDGFSYLDVKISNENFEIDEKLLREGAIIYLLCDLNDMIQEFDEDYLKCEITQKIIAKFRDNKLAAIPETKDLFGLIENPKLSLDYKDYETVLSNIYKKYVVGTFKKMISS